MEASPLPRHHPSHLLLSEKIKENLFKNGIKNPPPKLIHTLIKKQTQKNQRKISKKNSKNISLTPSQEIEVFEETHFQAIKAEFREIMVGKPWERGERVNMREVLGSEGEYGVSEGLEREHLRELGGFLEREREKFKWLLDDKVEEREEEREWVPKERRGGESEAIRFLVEKLSSTQLNVKDYKFSKMMKQSKLSFTESQLLKIVGRLGDIGQWKHALSVVEWVYSSKEHRNFKTRFVYTKLLAVLGKARRPHEALQIFYLMAEDAHIYPDMAAYHSIAVTLGQNGYLKELIKIIESMSEKPSRRTKNYRHKNWDPTLQPDMVVFNAVLNACVPSRQWKGVSWVFQQLRKHSLKPNGPTYGLAMEVMLHSGKYDLVHEFFEKMKRSGEAPKALTYKVLVSAFWQEDRVDEAVEAVRDMEKRGVVGNASVYYELACCLCNKGRWQEAMMEVEKLKSLKLSKPLQVTFTGMIMSSLDGGHVRSCISIFEQSKNHCDIDIGLINAILKVYGSNDMFSKAKEMFEVTKRSIDDTYGNMSSDLNPDAYTYVTMLKASASAQQWDYFEFVYRDMVLSGYVIDQTKHGSLLVEASKAGKLLLLEHAFDVILEAGEIPHLSFFTELICQAMVHRNIERGLSLIKALAYAPSQISEKQWLDFFERNTDRISTEILYELLESLKKSELPKEVTVSNLRRSLVSYCKALPNSDEDTDMTGTIVNPSETFLCDYLHDEGRKELANVTYSESDKERDALATISKSFDHVCDEEREAVKKCTPLENMHFSSMFGEGDNDSDDDFDYVDSDDEEIKDMQFDIRGVTNGSKQPSANEILESWKQSREKDGSFSKFQ